MRIKSILDIDNRDYSDQVFTIIPNANPPELIVLGPNGGESWDLGADVSITWFSANVPGLLKVSLHKDAEGQAVGVCTSPLRRPGV